MKFNATYAGSVYSMTDGTLYDFSDGAFYGVSGYAYVDEEYITDSPRVALTGYYLESSRGNIGYQTKSGKYIILSEGWEKVGVAPIAQYSQTQAQALVNKIIRNNKIIISNNLLCARFANRLSEAERSRVRELQQRLVQRDDALKGQGLTKDVQTSYPAGYAELSAYLDALMAGETIGIATWAFIVIAAVVIAGLGTAAYFAYKSLADESEQDVKYSKELTSILTAKLTEEEYQQLKDETKGIVTKAKIKQALGSYWNALKWVAIGVGGYALYKIIKNNML